MLRGLAQQFELTQQMELKMCSILLQQLAAQQAELSWCRARALSAMAAL
jgi:hypothetical protein